MIGGKTLFSNRKSWESHDSGKHCFQSGKAGKVMTRENIVFNQEKLGKSSHVYDWRENIVFSQEKLGKSNKL